MYIVQCTMYTIIIYIVYSWYLAHRCTMQCTWCANCTVYSVHVQYSVTIFSRPTSFLQKSSGKG